MIRIEISAEQVKALEDLRHTALKPAERDRVEMLLLHAQGWSAGRISRFLGYSDTWVRQVLRAFAANGLDSIYLKKPGPPQLASNSTKAQNRQSFFKRRINVSRTRPTAGGKHISGRESIVSRLGR